MTLVASILMLALTRAEIIERFKNPPVTKADGLVQVFADCPSDMRHEYQAPVSSFVAEVCTTLSTALKERPGHFTQPAIIVYVGDIRTNNSQVVSREQVRPDGSVCTRIRLLAPGFTDTDQLRRETVKAFYRAVTGERIDDQTADRRFREADPRLRVAEEYDSIARWMRGERMDGDDEKYLKLMRSVLAPGKSYPDDILRFASRLYLYPEIHSEPLCHKYQCMDFRTAAQNVNKDLRIRVLAYLKAPELIAFGGGRGEKLADASMLYSAFLREIAKGKMSEADLLAMLDAADLKLNQAMEEARLRAEGKIQ